MPRDDGFRLVCNRDERVNRAPALEPRRHALGSTSAVYPVDPEGGGTWIGFNDDGLVMAILNRSAARSAGLIQSDLRSRGALIPALLRYSNLPEAVHAARELELTDFAPFQLVAVQGCRVGIITWDGASRTSERITMTQPLLFTSSSLGDTLVEPPRRQLFVDLVINAPDSWLEGQQRFHRHQWSDRRDVSVQMARVGAHTVSRSAIDVIAGVSTFRYEPLGRPVEAA